MLDDYANPLITFNGLLFLPSVFEQILFSTWKLHCGKEQGKIAINAN